MGARGLAQAEAFLRALRRGWICNADEDFLQVREYRCTLPEYSRNGAEVTP